MHATEYKVHINVIGQNDCKITSPFHTNLRQSPSKRSIPIYSEASAYDLKMCTLLF